MTVDPRLGESFERGEPRQLNVAGPCVTATELAASVTKVRRTAAIACGAVGAATEIRIVFVVTSPAEEPFDEALLERSPSR